MPQQQNNIIIALYLPMAEPVKYITIISDMLTLYQKELIKIFKKYPHQVTSQFQQHFEHKYQQMKETQVNKSIKEELSLICDKMSKYFEQPVARINKTSLDYRKNLKSQSGNRQLRMTLGAQHFKRLQQNEEPIAEQQQLQDMINGYRISDELIPKMRMKWKNAYDPQRKIDNKERSVIGNNNIDLLSYTIPQMESSIRRLSLQRSPKSVKERQLDVYRTLESRSMKKKFIPKLF